MIRFFARLFRRRVPPKVRTWLMLRGRTMVFGYQPRENTMNEMTTEGGAGGTATEFAPPLVRRHRIPIGPNDTAPNGNGNGNHASADPQTLSQNAAMVAQGIEDLQKERDRLRHELDRANARIEQFTSNETRLISEIEGERARTAEAKAEAERHRGERKRLETVVGSMVNMGHDALAPQ